MADTMGIKEARRTLEYLQVIHEVATMKNANFYVFDPESDKKMDEIRELTRVWRESWILGPLEDLIDRFAVLAHDNLNARGETIAEELARDL